MDIKQLQQRNKELAILNTIAQNLNRELELEQALDQSLEQVAELMELQTAWIWLFNPTSQTAYLAASHKLPPVFEERPELLAGSCYCIKKYLTGNLENASNISEITCTRLENLLEGTSGLRYHASIPLFSQGEKLGILNVLSADSQELSEDKLRLLYTIGDMLSIAIDRSRLFTNSHQAGVVEERNRLAREIHDTLAQGLAAISLRLESMEILLEQKAPIQKVQQQISSTLKLTRHSLEEARRSVLDLRASPLENANLATALETLVQELEEPQSLQGHFQLFGQYRRLPQRIEMGIFRIAQEALHNIRQHAQAQNFSLHIHYQQHKLHLLIEDDGIGFDTDQEVKGFGLVGLNERANLIHAHLEVRSQLQKGTQIKVSIVTTADEK